jgi:hypothetical protein
MRNSKGISLVEIMVAMFILSLTVASMMKALDKSMQGQTRVRNDLRAITIAKTKLDALKDHVRLNALAGTFNMVTSSPQVLAYGLTQVATVDGKAFTWVVNASYVLLTPSVSAPTETNTAQDVLKLKAMVYWTEGNFPRYATQTVMVTDFNQ